MEGQTERVWRREVPLVNLVTVHGALRSELLAAMADVLDSGRYLFGPPVSRLEQALATYCGVRHAIGCASGSDALLLSLMALEIGPGDEVIVPSFTFFATASAVWRLGAKPVFVDIDPYTFTLQPSQVQRSICRQTRAIIAVHLFGRCADMSSLSRIAATHQIPLIEDAAQAIGAEYQGRRAGAWGTMGCFSFYPTKNLGGCGDGGMITTHEDHYAERLRTLANHGMHPRYVHPWVGINSRLDSLQAAILEVKLRYLDHWIDERRKHAERYRELFDRYAIGEWIQLPFDTTDGRHVWNQFTIRVAAPHRDELRRFLAQRGVSTEVYYPLPLHLQPCFRDLGYRPGDLPETERAAQQVLSLPIYPGLTADEQAYVVEQIRQYQLVHARTAA